MASFFVSNETVKFTVPDLEDDMVALIVRDLTTQFGRNGGAWLKLAGDTSSEMHWFPAATSRAIARFDDGFPEELADLPVNRDRDA